MSIKVKFRGNGKAMVKFSHPVDEQYFLYIIRTHRDDGQPHPKIVFKNVDGGAVPKLEPPKPLPKVEPPKPTQVTDAQVMPSSVVKAQGMSGAPTLIKQPKPLEIQR